MPERVLTTGEFNRLLSFYRSGRGGEYDAATDTLNVHDAALRERLREVEEERELWRRAHIRAEEGIRALRADLVEVTTGFIERGETIGRLTEQEVKLRAERDVLVPLAWWGLQEALGFVPEITPPTDEQIAQARAILSQRTNNA